MIRAASKGQVQRSGRQKKQGSSHSGRRALELLSQSEYKGVIQVVIEGCFSFRQYRRTIVKVSSGSVEWTVIKSIGSGEFFFIFLRVSLRLSCVRVLLKPLRVDGVVQGSFCEAGKCFFSSCLQCIKAGKF